MGIHIPMPPKPHTYYRLSSEAKAKFSQPIRDVNRDEVEIEKNYLPKKEDFFQSRKRFFSDREERNARRNTTLSIPSHIDFIEITFHSSFDTANFENKYRRLFGLSACSYSHFNTVGLFAIVNEDDFEEFWNSIEAFINTDDHTSSVDYPREILFIKEFKLLTTKEIKGYDKLHDHVILSLVENVEIFQDHILPTEISLTAYLTQEGIKFNSDFPASRIELFNVEESLIEEIADNFDIIHRINSFLAGIVEPNVFNVPSKSYGFQIGNYNEVLPIIGVIDTGVSADTPLKDILINKDLDFSLTDTSAKIDIADHGTAVAGLAALGDRLYPDSEGIFDADCRILSIKLMDGKNGQISETEVVRLIREAVAQYGVKLFTLTIGYQYCKKYNEAFSSYAYSLDLLAYELDILIFISVGNVDNLWELTNSKWTISKYPDVFEKESHNLCIPAESRNNLTIGAVAGNLEVPFIACITPDCNFPAIYSRTCHLNWKHPSVTPSNINPKLFKPDLCYFAGDYDQELGIDNTGIKILSSSPGIFFQRQIGTSYSTPLVANIAAKLLRRYPDLYSNMQTLKALIVNGCQNGNIEKEFSTLKEIKLNSIMGHGLPNVASILHSSEDSITFILEDSIKIQSIQSYVLKIPEYLASLGSSSNKRRTSVLYVDATLCFRFKPLSGNHLAYCPLHIAFGVFKNLPLDEYESRETPKGDKTIAVGINGNNTASFSFNQSWSQDYYWKSKMLSNTQKVSFTIFKETIIQENYRLKIAVNAKLHRQISPYKKANYEENEHPFSIVFTIREKKFGKTPTTGNLYDELTQLNSLEMMAMNDIDNLGD